MMCKICKFYLNDEEIRVTMKNSHGDNRYFCLRCYQKYTGAKTIEI